MKDASFSISSLHFYISVSFSRKSFLLSFTNTLLFCLLPKKASQHNAFKLGPHCSFHTLSKYTKFCHHNTSVEFQGIISVCKLQSLTLNIISFIMSPFTNHKAYYDSKQNKSIAENISKFPSIHFENYRVSHNQTNITCSLLY